MSFIEKNKYFLQQVNREIYKYKNSAENISFDALKDFYKVNFQSTMRNRIKDSYESSKNIAKYYTDLYESIGEFEADLITINFLLEKDLFNILWSFKMQERNFHFESEFLEYMYKNFIFNSFRDFPSFRLKIKEISHKILNVSDSDWIRDDKNVHPIIRGFTDSINNQNFFDSYLNLIVIWYRFEEYHSPFNNIKAILLTNLFNKKFEQDDPILNQKYVDFLDAVQELKNNLFSYLWLQFLPFTQIDSFKCSEGLTKQSKKLFERYHFLKFLQDNNDDYINLILKIINTKNDRHKSQILDRINERIKEFEIPSAEGFELLNKIDNDIIKRNLISTFYRFELL